MGASSGAREQRILESAHEQITREIEELTQSSPGISQRALAERALSGGDDELRDELRSRFDHGRLSGKFPLLSWYSSELSDEEKEEFFRADWLRVAIPPPEPPKEPWEYALYNGDEEY